MTDNKTVECAIAMLAVLTEKPGEHLSAAELRAGLVAHHVDPHYVHMAAKWLRDRGIPVATRKSRHLSTWWVQGSNRDLDGYLDRITKEAFSEQVSITRAVSRLQGDKSRTLRRKALTTAVVLGERLGLDAEQIVHQCQPLPMAMPLDGMS